MLKTIETIIRTFSDAFSDLNLEGEIQIDGVGSPPAGWSSLGGGVVFKTFFEFFFLESKNKIFRLKFCFFLHQKKLAFIFNFAFLFRGRLIAMSSFQNVFVIFHFFSFFLCFDSIGIRLWKRRSMEGDVTRATVHWRRGVTRRRIREDHCHPMTIFLNLAIRHLNLAKRFGTIPESSPSF